MMNGSALSRVREIQTGRKSVTPQAFLNLQRMTACKQAKGRRTHTEEIIATLDKAFSKFTKDELAARLDEEQIAWSPIQTLAQVTQDPQVHAAGGIVETPSPAGGTFKAPGGPARFPGADDGPKGPAPTMGEHTRQTLTRMGFENRPDRPDV